MVQWIYLISLVILNVLVESAKLTGLEDAESDKENNAKNEWIDTTQYQVLHLKVTTCKHATCINAALEDCKLNCKAFIIKILTSNCKR